MFDEAVFISYSDIDFLKPLLSELKCHDFAYKLVIRHRFFVVLAIILGINSEWVMMNHLIELNIQGPRDGWAQGALAPPPPPPLFDAKNE